MKPTALQPLLLDRQWHLTTVWIFRHMFTCLAEKRRNNNSHNNDNDNNNSNNDNIGGLEKLSKLSTRID